MDQINQDGPTSGAPTLRSNYPRRPKSPRALLNGRSPQERAVEKLIITLGWIGLFHYSTERLLKKVLTIQGSGLLRRLEERQLVKAVPVFSIASQRVWTLTPAGAVDASIAANRDLRYPHNPERVSGNFLKHNLLVQQTLTEYLAVTTQNVTRILPARLLSTGVWGEAIPDVLFSHQPTEHGFTKTALEIELTYKKDHELERKFKALMEMLAANHTLQICWHLPSDSMAQHYRRAWEAVDSDQEAAHQVKFLHDASLLQQV